MITFSKYHGCGNNFVIVRESDLPAAIQEEAYPSLTRAFCDINTGVGADGLIIVREEPALEMVIFNRDGSRAPMCGNGIRCFAHYCKTQGIRKEQVYPVKTLAGEMIVEVTCEDPFQARINMGRPIFDPAAISVDFDGENYLNQTLMLGDGVFYTINSLFMGTVHTVVFTDSYEGMDVPKLGQEICDHPTFKEKTNVNFVRCAGDDTLEVRTYERGVGMTLACGTGSCASVVVANMQGLCKKRTEVILALGSLMIEIGDDGNIYMEGPSVKILDGTFYEEEKGLLL